MNRFFHVCIYLVLLCCIVSLYVSNRKLKSELPCNVVDTITVSHDTIIIRDTLKADTPKPSIIRIKDTLYIPYNDKPIVDLPVYTKMYTDDYNYKIWVSGIQTSLDSVHIYNNIKYVTNTNTVYRDVEKNVWSTYMFMGANQFKDGFSPSVGVSFKSPRRWLFTFETGYIDNNMWGGVKIGYKIR